MSRETTIECQICHELRPASQVISAEFVRGPIAELIRREHPTWNSDGYVCLRELNQYRARQVEEMLVSERGELSQLERDVVDSLGDEELLAQNIEATLDATSTLSERLADRLAEFGGSWTFLMLFGAFIAVWIGTNSAWIASSAPDPYPFIFLNLLLSCIAAIQAPVILMSQNRHTSKDRVRAEHDYRINLKSEVEIRNLHSKLDLLLTHQWRRLLEIQQLQIDLMQEIAAKR
jgi:uncharacterized membrane protein